MRNMKAVATTLLLLAVLGSVISWNFRANFTGGLLFAAFEAALVGALADWFAVVALFRHPLGLKFIPHTAIIPNNRERIIEAIVKIVETDWLSLEFISDKVQAYPLIDGITAALQTDQARRGLEEAAQSISTNIIQNLEPEKMSEFTHLVLAENLDELNISPGLVISLEDSVKHLYSEDVINLVIDWAIASTKGEEFEKGIRRILSRAASDYSNQGTFLRRLGKGLGESLDIVNYDEAADILARRVNHFLIEMKSPQHHLHQKIKHEIENLQLIDPLSASTIFSDALRKFIGTEAGLNATTELFAAVKEQMLKDSERGFPLVSYLTTIILEQIAVIQQDEVRKADLEAWVKSKIMSLLERYHGVIGKMVREKLQSLNDAGLVQSLEDKVGDDLQWIRVNGTVIGALVGIGQYLILHLL